MDTANELAAVLKACKGYVRVSGNNSDLYRDLFAGWRRVEKVTYAQSRAKAVEQLWISPNVPTADLFAGAP